MEQELIEEIQKGLLKWYEFQEKGKVLYIGEKGAPLAQMLSEKNLHVTCMQMEAAAVPAWQQENEGKFDYLICVEELEKQQNPEAFLEMFRGLLGKEGVMLLGMNNRLGLRYFSGDKDKYTNRCFDGVEGYKAAYKTKEDVFKGRSYSMAEIRKMLTDTGWQKVCFYSVFPDLRNPSLLYSERFLPNEDLANRLIPFYHHPRTVFLDEKMLYNDLAENGMFHQMANGYLVECALGGTLSDVDHVTCSMDRGRNNALFTMIHSTGVVEKRAAYEEGVKRLESFIENGRDLSAHGIKMVDAKLEAGSYKMPYVKGEVGQLYLKRLLKTEKETFLQAMDHFRDLILQSSDIVRADSGDGEGAILRRGYLDMVPLNSFYVDGEFVFYDQEFYEDNYPANAIITRMITTFYCGNEEAEKIVPMDELFARYQLLDKKDIWRRMEYDFLRELLNVKTLQAYYGKHRPTAGEINSNRQRINYSGAEYRRIFIDIFQDADAGKLVLFGSGNFARKFMELYRKDYPVYTIVDNREDRWGEEINGVRICSPEILKEWDSDEYKVIVCIKNFASVIGQLENLGVKKYSIYDADIGYGRKKQERLVCNGGDGGGAAPKKYHTGYISGVFDLFHIGHLNMFRRAKEQCEYLIVGVVTDEGVRKNKKVEPFVPFEERIEMVRSCRYVDEAVEIPLQYNDTREAYKLYRFDCQFSGSDYSDDPFWINNREFLRENGAELVFFPYTESTSSSKIKSLIDKRLM